MCVCIHVFIVIDILFFCIHSQTCPSIIDLCLLFPVTVLSPWRSPQSLRNFQRCKFLGSRWQLLWQWCQKIATWIAWSYGLVWGASPGQPAWKAWSQWPWTSIAFQAKRIWQGLEQRTFCWGLALWRHCPLFFVFAQKDFCGWRQFAVPLFSWIHPTASVPSVTQLATLDMAQFEMGTGWQQWRHFCMQWPCWLEPDQSLSSQLAASCFLFHHWNGSLMFLKAWAPLVPDAHSHQLLVMASVSSSVTSLWEEAGWNHCTRSASAQNALVDSSMLLWSRLERKAMWLASSGLWKKASHTPPNLGNLWSTKSLTNLLFPVHSLAVLQIGRGPVQEMTLMSATKPKRPSLTLVAGSARYFNSTQCLIQSSTVWIKTIVPAMSCRLQEKWAKLTEGGVGQLLHF